ncbi:uncharacterized protein A4U43_C03F24360, partial [Asparagus officinalis]
MDPATKAAFENMRFYKFYPVQTPDTPDISKDASIAIAFLLVCALVCTLCKALYNFVGNIAKANYFLLALNWL